MNTRLVLKSVFFSLLLSVSSFSYASDESNLYVIVETDTTPLATSRTIGSLQKIFSNIEKGALYIDNVFIRNAADRSSYNKSKVINGGMLRNNLPFNRLPAFEKYRSNAPVLAADVLSLISGDLKAFNWRPDNTIILYMGDIIYKNGKVSSREGYLSQGFLNNKRSPFVSKLINKSENGSGLENIKIVVLGKQSVSPRIHQGQRRFIARLFEEVESTAEFLFYGPMLGGVYGNHDYSVEVLKAAKSGEFTKITSLKEDSSDDSELVTIHKEGADINNVKF